MQDDLDRGNGTRTAHLSPKGFQRDLTKVSELTQHLLQQGALDTYKEGQKLPESATSIAFYQTLLFPMAPPDVIDEVAETLNLRIQPQREQSFAKTVASERDHVRTIGDLVAAILTKSRKEKFNSQHDDRRTVRSMIPRYAIGLKQKNLQENPYTY